MQRHVRESATEDCGSTNLPGGSFMNMPFASYRKARVPLARKVLALALAGLIIMPNQGRAAAGDLDMSFGTGGKVTTDFGGHDAALAVALQTDGKIVAAGLASVIGSEDFALARDNGAGALDVSFGTGGKVTTDFAGDLDQALAVAVQTDGKIVAAGLAFVSGIGENFALARYNMDGSLDMSFGTGGKVTTDFAGSFGAASAVALQTDGKIV